MQEWKINTVYPGININSSDTFKLHAESDVYEKSKRRDVLIVDVIRYPYESCLCIFWHCHPYFILQFYSIVFYTCYYSGDENHLCVANN